MDNFFKRCTYIVNLKLKIILSSYVFQMKINIVTIIQTNISIILKFKRFLVAFIFNIFVNNQLNHRCVYNYI